MILKIELMFESSVNSYSSKTGSPGTLDGMLV